jgi:thioredoxin 1
MPSQIKEYYKDDKPGFLEELITRQLLLSEAKRQKIYNQEDYKDYVKQNPDKKEDIMVNLLLRKIANSVTLSENDLKDFYNQYKDQLPNKDYESVKEQLRPMALEEKQRLKIDEFINKLKSKAKIVRNEKWIKEQESATADNPLSKALKSKRPVLADFGRGTCIPCKMMQPILEKLQKEYAGKAEILIIDVGEYAALARKYKIMIIPTQIFFDSSGKEVYRHQGFMPEQDIIAQLKKMGVE